MTPLIMTSSTSELFEFNKMLFIYFTATLIFFFWSFKMIVNKKIILKKTFLDIPIIVFLLIQILSTIFSIDPHTSFFGYYGRFNGGLLSTITYIFLYYGIVSNISDSDKFGKFLSRLLKISLVSSVLVILWGLPGHFGHDLSCLVFSGQFTNACWTAQFHPDIRMFSTLGQPNWLGAYLAINFFIAAYMLSKRIFLNEPEKKDPAKGYIRHKNTSPSLPVFISGRSLILYGYLFLNFSAVLFTRSRSALVAVIAAILLWFGAVIALFVLRKKRFGLTYIILPVSILMVISLFVFKTDIVPVDRILSFSFLSKPKIIATRVLSTPTSSTLPNTIEITGSLAIRKIVWKGAIRLANRYPLLGTGPETFAYAYYFVRPAAHNMTSEWDYLYNKAHNEYLNYLATTGYLGLFTYMSFVIGVIVLLIRYAVKSVRKNPAAYDDFFLSTCFAAAYATILITNLVGFSTTTINLFFFIIPALLVLHTSQQRIAKEERVGGQVSIIQWLGIAAIVAITICMEVYIVRYYFADTMYALGDNYAKQGAYQTAVTYLQDALKLKYEHVYEDRLSYVLANLSVIAAYQKQSDAANQLIALADRYNKDSIRASPKNVLYWKTRAKNEYLFYEISLNTQYIETGIQALQEAYRLSPTDPKIPYSLAVFYSLLYDDEKNQAQKDMDEAQSLQYVRQSVHLKTDYRDAYLLEGQLFKKYGMKAQAKQAFEYILTHLNTQDQEARKELQSL